MKKSLLAKIIVVSVLGALLIANVVFVTAVSLVYTPKKRAVIIMPGLCCGAIEDTATGEVIWDPLEADEHESFLLDSFFQEDKMLGLVLDVVKNSNALGMLNAMLNDEPGSMYYKWLLDENGLPPESVKAVSCEHEGFAKYGAMQSMRRPYEFLYERYKDEKNTDTFVFNYDWRLDNRLAAAELLKRTEEYDDVVIFAHSMGNIVTSLALAESESFRDKVSLFISSAPPYYGAFLALQVLEDGEKIVSDLCALGKNINIPLVGAIAKNLMDGVEELVNGKLLPMFRSYPSLVQLLPTIEEVCPDGVNSVLTVNGKGITTREELLAFYQSRSWAFRADGSIRPWVADLGEYWDAFYVDGTFASELVNTHYIVGTGKNTPENVTITDGNDYSYVFTQSTAGDQTVSVNSATLGGKASKTYLMNDYLHNDCMTPISEELGAVIDKALSSVSSPFKRFVSAIETKNKNKK